MGPLVAVHTLWGRIALVAREGLLLRADGTHGNGGGDDGLGAVGTAMHLPCQWLGNLSFHLENGVVDF